MPAPDDNVVKEKGDMAVRMTKPAAGREVQVRHLLGATAVLVAAALALGACDTTSRGESDRLAWDRGLVSIPDRAGCHLKLIGSEDARTRCLQVAGAQAAAPRPVVVFLHGCAGFNSRQYHVMDLFIDNGYAVFAPDSFERPGRYRACGSARQVLHLRMAEIDYALARLRELPWVDTSRLVLAGFSSGGIAAAEYGGDAFRARVVLGWGCNGGIGAPGDVAVLNLVGRRDFETRHGNALCSVGGRGNSLARHVEAGHNVADDPEARRIVADFLARVF